MPRMKLTAKAVEKVTLPKTGRVDYFDEITTGFALRVASSGAKSYCIFYRAPRETDDKIVVKRHTIGDATKLTLKDARDLAKQEFARIAAGADPAQERKDQRKVVPKPNRPNTYREVVADFIEKYAQPRQRRWKQTEGMLLGCTDWLDRPIKEITKTDAYDLLDRMKEKHPRKASITLQWLKTMYRWAWKRDIVDVPIMDAVEIETEQGSRDRWFTDDEIKAMWKGVEELGPLNANYVRLLILLATRKSELAGMRRSELDDPKKPTVWTIPHERTKTRKSARKKRVYIEPLTPLAARIISSLPELEDDLVFPGRHKGKPIVPGNWLQTRVQKLSGIDDWNFHACRHTVATWLQNEGISEWERGLVLNHAEGSVTAGYSHGFATDRKRELLEMWENHVKSLVAPDGVESLYG